MMNWSKVSLKIRLVVVGAALTTIPIVALSIFVIAQEQRMEKGAAAACRDLAIADLDHQAQGVIALCATVEETRQQLAASGQELPPEAMAKLRESIMAMEVGETGYVYVLDSEGHYVISKDGKRDGELIRGAKDASGRLFIQDICRKASALKPGEVAEDRYPWQNAGDPEPREKIVRIMYFAPWDWVVGVGSYIEEFEAAERSVAAINRQNIVMLAVLGAVCALLAVGVWWWVSAAISRRVTAVTLQLDTAAVQVAAAADQIAQTSQQAAEAASEQAASLQDLTTSLTEIASVVEQNATNASKTNDMTDESETSAKQGVTSLGRMQDAISDIQESSNETAKILKTIDEIAFQTNLLALNAAVEAARAGDAGKGFAVVAEEVRNLAQRSAEAAKNTAALIDTAQSNAENGVKVTEEVGEIFGSIAQSVGEVSKLVHEVSVASNRQSQNFEQINATLGQMDTVTQSNAASAEESAASSEELSGQANELQDMVAVLYGIVNGTGGTNPHRGSGHDHGGDGFRLSNLTHWRSKKTAAKPPTVPSSAAEFEQDFETELIEL